MKRILTLAAFIGLIPALSSNAQVFTPGNLAVERVGTGTGALSSAGTAVFIDEITTAGVAVQSFAIPSSGATALVNSGTATSEGQLTRSTDGSELVLAGYNVAAGTTGVTSGASTAVPRTVGTLDSHGNFTLGPSLGTNFSANNIRSATSDGAGHFWAGGASAGTVYLTSTSSNSISPAPANTRSTEIFNGILYTSTGSGTHGVYSLGAVPTTPVTSALVIPDSGSPYDYAVSPDGNTFYVADDSATASGGGVQKYTNGPSGFALQYTLATGLTAGTRSLAVDFTGASPVIYAVTADSSANKVVAVTDTGSTSPFTTLATAVANTAYRGVKFAPQASGSAPSITTQPSDQFVTVGDNATFSVVATGTDPVTYQWFSNTVAISYGTTNSITITNVQLAADGSVFYVTLSNAFGMTNSTSNTLHVTASLKPAIISVSPSNATVNAGGSASFTVTSSGADATLWYLGSTLLSDGGAYTGTGSSTLNISGALAANAGNYFVVVSNQYGMATSGPIAFAVVDPVITVAPVGTTNFSGTSYTLSVTAAGTQPLTYAWLTNGVQDTSVDPSSSTYTFNSAAPQQTLVSVTVSNALGAFVTSAATVFDITPYLISDDFNYTNGPIVPQSTWLRDSPTTGPFDSFITNVSVTDIFDNTGTNGVYVINQLRADDIDHKFTVPQTNGQVYASFSITMTQLPASPGGTYFAHFTDINQTNNGPRGFWARIYSLTTNTPAGMWRLGLANNQDDYDHTSSVLTGPDTIYPLDLALNTPYQVVVEYDIDGLTSTLWVNPASETDENVEAHDPNTPTGTNFVGPMTYYGFRQNGGEGVMYIDNLRVAASFDDVTTNLAALALIGQQPVGITNYSGNNLSLEVAASGKGITYQWYKDDVSLGGSANEAILPLVNQSSADNGAYYVVLTTLAGSITSDVANVLISDSNTKPVFDQQPQNTTGFLGSQAVFTADAVGTGPISYQWYLNDGTNVFTLGDNGITVIGGNTARLVLNHLVLSEAGTVYVVASGPGGSTQSGDATLTITAPPVVSIATLRALETGTSGTTWSDSAGSTLYAVVGTITTSTNLTTGKTSSYYLQDSTGGINLFVSGDSSFRPALGTQVTASGTLTVFRNELELSVNATLGNNVYFVNSDNLGSNIVNNLPTPQVAPINFLNNTANQSYLASNLNGSLITVTNVTIFGPGGSIPTNFAGGSSVSYIASNAQGSVTLFLASTVTNLLGVPVPRFAYSITAPLVRFNNTWELELTSLSQIVTNPPPAVTVHTTLSNGVPTLTWAAVPYSYAYTVLGSSNVTGPYAPIGSSPVSSAVVFTNGTGSFTDSSASGDTMFYQVVSP
ncbi:MAG TPA: immunoglobulin domain-containing protein [Verrucomicrobiae bacterium]|jgi:hypothetical protein|nr:immunoglobulin domain-containing protein [Verrucomicrobiae bacterium]